MCDANASSDAAPPGELTCAAREVLMSTSVRSLASRRDGPPCAVCGGLTCYGEFGYRDVRAAWAACSARARELLSLKGCFDGWFGDSPVADARAPPPPIRTQFSVVLTLAVYLLASGEGASAAALAELADAGTAPHIRTATLAELAARVARAAGGARPCEVTPLALLRLVASQEPESARAMGDALVANSPARSRARARRGGEGLAGRAGGRLDEFTVAALDAAAAAPRGIEAAPHALSVALAAQRHSAAAAYEAAISSCSFDEVVAVARRAALRGTAWGVDVALARLAVLGGARPADWIAALRDVADVAWTRGHPFAAAHFASEWRRAAAGAPPGAPPGALCALCAPAVIAASALPGYAAACAAAFAPAYAPLPAPGDADFDADCDD